ncbi:hypothetical protein [Salegentibacter echinorum]|nr:hypothetical protein [Salegentibacter echinorum]
MKTILKISWALFFLCLSATGFSQEQFNSDNKEENIKIRPIRIGVKMGFPNLIGGNLEYVTPLLNDKLAVFLDYSKLNSDLIKEALALGSGSGEDDQLDFSYLEGGLQYYFFKPGRGLYAGVSYGSIKLEATLNDISSNEDPNRTGTGKIDFNNNSFNIKLGAKLGGLFYFRPEIGYSFTALPNSVPMKVVFEDGSREQQTEQLIDDESPQNLLLKGYMINLGIGFAF